jgi:hypothetical protein
MFLFAFILQVSLPFQRPAKPSAGRKAASFLFITLPRKKAPPKWAGVVKRLFLKKAENVVLSRGGVTQVTPFPFSQARPKG